MREKPGIAEEELRTCLQEEYGLMPVTIEYLPRGLDYNAGVYRVVSEEGIAYLLKVKLGSLYEAGCLVPGYLRDQGIAGVVAPLPTRRNSLWTRLGAWSVIVYPFVEGDTNWEGMTDGQWKEVGSVFKQIHQVMLPPGGFESLREETFDPTEYVRQVRTLEAQQIYAEGGNDAQRALRSSWLAHQTTIQTGVATMEKLAGGLQRRSGPGCTPSPPGRPQGSAPTIPAGPYVICHADLHQANLIRNAAGHVFVIDWDDVMLALKERDFIFVRRPQAGAFFQGYGEVEVDWMALTYYQWERAVTDMIVIAQDVFFRDDWGEELRAYNAQLFERLFEVGGNVDAAFDAAGHLPAEILS